MSLGSLFFVFLIILAVIILCREVWIKERKEKKKFASEEKFRQNVKIYKEIVAQKKLLREIPKSAFGIYRGDQISQLSTNKVNLNFAQHEISVPKPHSMLDKYYADVWEDNNQLRTIYGISRIFNLENQDVQQVEITDLFLRLKKQLSTKYGGPDDLAPDVTSLLSMNEELLQKKFQIMDNPLYKYIYETMESKYKKLYGENAFNPLMLGQITPSHAAFGAEWNFSSGDIQRINIGCRRIDNLTQTVNKIADKAFDDGARIIMKSEKGLELTNEEKETYEKVIDFIRKEERLFGNICIFVQFSFQFNDYDRRRRLDKILRKDIIERNGSREDWDAL